MAFGLSLFKDTSVAQYNPQRIQCTWGEVALSGFAPDTFINITKNAPVHSMVKGIDGKNAYLSNKDFDAQVSFILLQNSDTNKFLWEMYNKGHPSGNATVASQLVITDYNMGMAWESPFAFINEMPSVGYAARSGTTEWKFYCNNLKNKQGIVDGENFTTEQLLIKKVEETIQSVGKTISGIFS